VLDEAADRYGPLPESVLNLADYGRIRVMADRLGVESIDREGRTVVLKFRPQAKVDPVRLVALVRQRPDLTLIPPAGLKLSLDGTRDQKSSVRDQGSGPMAASAKAISGRKAFPEPKPLSPGPKAGGTKSQAAPPSWWTARARTGEVTPGFTKAEILKPAKDDPRAPGGAFERVGQLLSELLGEM
jgi:transcription-repair coupling factor (superfamily II helicase)